MMKTGVLSMAVVLACGSVSSQCLAGKDTKLKPTLVAPGAVLLEETFTGQQLSGKWQISKGNFEIIDGVVSGREKPEQKHAAVLTCKVPNHNSAIRLSFKLGRAKAFHLSFNRSRGHLFRVIVTSGGILLRTDKPSKKSTVKPDTLARNKKRFQPNEWYTMLVEVRGEDVAVTIDNGVTLKGSHPTLNVDKPNYRFIVRGESFQLDDVRIWNAKR